MKKLLTGALALLATATLAACSPKTAETATSSSATESLSSASASSSETKQTAYTIGQEVVVGDVAYVVNGKELTTNVGGEFGKTANGVFVVLDVTVTNRGKKALTVDSNFFTLLKGDVEFDADSSAGIYANTDANFFLTSLNPENSLTGKVVFDVNEETANDPSLQLRVQTGFWGTETAAINLH